MLFWGHACNKPEVLLPGASCATPPAARALPAGRLANPRAEAMMPYKHTTFYISLRWPHKKVQGI